MGLTIDSISVTRHAWQRFVDRWPGSFPRCPRAALKGLLSRSEPEDIGVGQVLRMMANGYREAWYYRCDGWRFVMSQDGTLLLTCERIVHEKREARPLRIRRRP